DHTIPAAANATAAFKEDGSVSGKSFCNGFGGSYTLQGDSLKFGPLMGTKMYCEQVGSAETNFLNDMALVNRVAIKSGKLHLMQDSKTLLIFSKPL
ncbi:MAG: META domain-containing protein, partial [Sphingobacteriales bacterium]